MIIMDEVFSALSSTEEFLSVLIVIIGEALIKGRRPPVDAQYEV
jgi:hypothetical protein